MIPINSPITGYITMNPSQMKTGLSINCYRTVADLIKEHGELENMPQDNALYKVHGLYRGENHNGFFMRVESFSIHR